MIEKKSYFNLDRNISVKEELELRAWKNSPENIDKRWYPGETTPDRPGLVFQKYFKSGIDGEFWCKIEDYKKRIFFPSDENDTKKSFFSVNRQLSGEEWSELVSWSRDKKNVDKRFHSGDTLKSKPGLVFDTYGNTHPNGEIWVKREVFKKKIHENIPNKEGKTSRFFLGRRLNQEEFLELRKWRTENPDLVWKKGDKRREHEDLYFIRYARGCSNGEDWGSFVILERTRARIRKKAKEWAKRRTAKDPIFKFAMNMRCLISGSFRRNNHSKGGTRTASILGLPIEEFKKYIESLWEPWMNDENYGTKNGVFPKEIRQNWEIDHIIPISTAKTKEDIIRLNHYTNLQPLCSYENRWIKTDKLNYKREVEKV